MCTNCMLVYIIHDVLLDISFTKLQSWQNAWIIIVEMLQQIWHAVKQGCIRLRNAMDCISEAISTVMEGKFAGCKTAEATVMASVADCWGEANSTGGRPQA